MTTRPLLPLLVLLVSTPSLAADSGTGGDGAEASTEAAFEPASAEQERLLRELDRLARKGQWKGVERTWGKLVARGEALPASAYTTAGDAARQRGDATEAQRRYLKAERLAPESTNAALDQYRSDYGVLEVRRVEASCIRLEPGERPFDPTKAAAIDFAGGVLRETGAFRGLVPTGDYTVGGSPVTITPGMKPHVVQRTAGDSDCK